LICARATATIASVRTVSIAVAAGVALAWQPRPTEACSPPSCQQGFIVPATDSTVPANIPALYWRSLFASMNMAGDPTGLTLATTSDPGTHLPFTTMVIPPTSPYPYRTDALVIPDQPLAEGTSYVLSDANACDDRFPVQAPMSTFHVGPAAPLPTELGTLTIGTSDAAELELATISGACTAPVQTVTAPVTLTLAMEAMPWRDALHLETYVDGVKWYQGNTVGQPMPPGSNGKGRGLDLVFTICHRDDLYTYEGLTPGVHLITMRATLPGSNLMVETPPASVQLECPPDAIHADVTEVDEPGSGETGCGCHTSDARSAGSLLLAFLTLLRRRRRPA
jgi:MYXO-CTERM domain-containing protein